VALFNLFQALTCPYYNSFYGIYGDSMVNMFLTQPPGGLTGDPRTIPTGS